jgi:hypothetical protein
MKTATILYFKKSVVIMGSRVHPARKVTLGQPVLPANKDQWVHKANRDHKANRVLWVHKDLWVHKVHGAKPV